MFLLKKKERRNPVNENAKEKAKEKDENAHVDDKYLEASTDLTSGLLTQYICHRGPGQAQAQVWGRRK